MAPKAAATSRATLVRSLVTAVRLAARPGGPSLGTRAAALPRIARSVLAGDYPGLTLSRLALAAAAVGYLLSPVDLVPEALLGPIGLGDDALVLGWLATTFVTETEAFLAWEGGRRDQGYAAGSPGAASGADREGREGTGTTWSPAAETVTGSVVR